MEEQQVMPAFDERTMLELKKTLDPSLIRDKPGKSQIVYLEGSAVISAANRIFGHGNWRHEVLQVNCEKATDASGAVIGLYYVALVKVGIFTTHGWIDYIDEGTKEVTPTRDGKITTEMHANARLTAATKGLKRTLRVLGDQFGLALYDKEEREELLELRAEAERADRASRYQQRAEQRHEEAQQGRQPLQQVHPQPVRAVLEQKVSSPQSPSASVQQIKSIRNLCKALGRSDIDADQLSEVEARQWLATLSREYQMKRAQ